MSVVPTPKYPAEFFLDFRSVDRFVYRVSDLYALDEHTSKELLARLDKCHIYLLGKRPRLTLVENSIQLSDDIVRFQVQYRIEGITHNTDVELSREMFRPEEVTFEVSEYPHREIVTRDATGDVVAVTLLANFVHLMPTVRQEAKDLDVVYVGKGLRNSAQDRLEHHATLQRILADINSNEPDMEVFALVYAFQYLKNLLAFQGIPADIAGDAARERREKAIAYKPSLDDQVALIEASAIGYFQPSNFNTHYLDFPDPRQQILSDVYAADFAAIVVQLDNTNIGGQRIYSQSVPPESTHYIVVDFRRIEGKYSMFEQYMKSRSVKDA